MNHMEQVAEILEVKFNEEFRVDEGYIRDFFYKLTAEGLMSTNLKKEQWVRDHRTLGMILNGEVTMVKKPWKPQKGETYFYIDDQESVITMTWRDDLLDYAHLKIGNCFRSRKEAEKSVLAYKRWIHSDPLNDWRTEN